MVNVLVGGQQNAGFVGSCLLGGSLFTLATGFPDGGPCRSLGAAIVFFRDRTAFLLYSPTNLNGAPGVALVRSPVKHTIQSQGEREMKQLLKPFAETVIVEPSDLVFSNRVNRFGGTSSRYGYNPRPKNNSKNRIRKV